MDTKLAIGTKVADRFAADASRSSQLRARDQEFAVRGEQARFVQALELLALRHAALASNDWLAADAALVEACRVASATVIDEISWSMAAGVIPRPETVSWKDFLAGQRLRATADAEVGIL